MIEFVVGFVSGACLVGAITAFVEVAILRRKL